MNKSTSNVKIYLQNSGCPCKAVTKSLDNGNFLHGRNIPLLDLGAGCKGVLHLWLFIEKYNWDLYNILYILHFKKWEKKNKQATHNLVQLVYVV